MTSSFKTSIVRRLVTLALPAAAMLVLAAIMHDMFPALLQAKPAPAVVTEVADWPTLSRGGHALGLRSAPLQIVEFTDFQCPACSQAAARMARFSSAHPGQVNVIVRHFPLTGLHPYAHDLAVASECAARHGAFDRFYTAAFAMQDSLEVWSPAELAIHAGIADTAALSRCSGETGPKATVASDVQAGRALALRGTPSFIVNGALYPSQPTDSTLERLLTSAVRSRP